MFYVGNGKKEAGELYFRRPLTDLGTATATHGRALSLIRRTGNAYQ